MMELHEKRDNAQNVHCPFFDVVPPTGFPKRCAEGAVIGRNLRRVCNLMCVLRQTYPRNKHMVRSSVVAVDGVSVE